MRKSQASYMVICCLCVNSVHAFPGETTHTLPEVHENFDVFSYIDGSYNYLLRDNRFNSGNFDRANDIQRNGLTLQQWLLSLQKLPAQGLGGSIDIILGQDTNEIVPNGINADILDNRVVGFLIPQAYLQYVKGPYALLVGEMQSVSGIEQYDYTGDVNFSRSILYEYAQPGIHVGVRGFKKINEQISLLAGINNGWNTVHQAAHLNTLEIGLNYEVNKKISLLVNLFGGPQYMTDNLSHGQTSQRRVLDIFGTWFMTDSLSLAANYDYAVQYKAALPDNNLGRATWQGLAGYVNYCFREKWYTSVRAEIFNDADGFRTGVKQNWREVTLSLVYQWMKQLKIYGEVRHDFSNVNAFQNKTGIGNSNNQQSYALNALYEFM